MRLIVFIYFNERDIDFLMIMYTAATYFVPFNIPFISICIASTNTNNEFYKPPALLCFLPFGHLIAVGR